MVAVEAYDTERAYLTSTFLVCSTVSLSLETALQYTSDDSGLSLQKGRTVFNIRRILLSIIINSVLKAFGIDQVHTSLQITH